MKSIVEVQSAYRRKLVEAWGIVPGSKVLEVGCGQGEMSEALAQAVGEKGRIVAVDLASPTYGAPETLQEATDRLKVGPLGDRLEFRFEFDVVSPHTDLGQFDVAVMANSSWYFASEAAQLDMFRTLHHHAEQFCFAEWDRTIDRPEQRAHALAVEIQERIEAFKSSSDANIRTPSTKATLMRLIKLGGWNIVRETQIDSDGMQDADWEIRYCLTKSRRELTEVSMPAEEHASISQLLQELESIALASGNRSLNGFALVAKA